MKHICVFGSVNENIDEKFKNEAYNLGKKIAENNYGLIYSGKKGGTSGSVAKGAASANKTPIIGIMPDYFKQMFPDEIFNECTEIIFTEDISKRKELMKQKADAIIVLPGGIGTLDEFFDTILTIRLGLIKKPIIIFNIDNYYNSLIKMIDKAIKLNFIQEEYKSLYKVCDNIQDIFNYIENYN